jgi:hypothetical protein
VTTSIDKFLSSEYQSQAALVNMFVHCRFCLTREGYILTTEHSIHEKTPVAKRPDVKFVVGIEDIPYFHWQLPILLESLSDKLPPGWEFFVVVCNNHLPLSQSLTDTCEAYNVKWLTTNNYPCAENIEFAAGGDCYTAVNRIQALKAVADSVGGDDLICLLETDIFLYKDLNLQVFPSTNSLAKNKLIEKELFFSYSQEPNGVNLTKLLDSMGCAHPWEPGGVILFLTGQTIQNQKFICDCFRFTQILYLMGKILDVNKIWVAEMPCFSLALTMNGIPYDVLHAPEFSTGNYDDPVVSPGTFYHYYRDLRDGADGAFYKSKWYKQLFDNRISPYDDIAYWASMAQSDHEKYFFYLVNRARLRIPLEKHLRLKGKQSG